MSRVFESNECNHPRFTSSIEPHLGQAVRAESIPSGNSTENNRLHEEQFFFITLSDTFSVTLFAGLESEISSIKFESKLSSDVNDLDSLESFIKDVIDCTHDTCAVYKPNFAFYEKYGPSGLKLLENVVSHIDRRAIIIADAKRGDIGNTSANYASSIFDYYNFVLFEALPEPFLYKLHTNQHKIQIQ